MARLLRRSVSDPAAARTSGSVFEFCFEAAGTLGLIATLMLCMLAFAVVVGPIFWITAGVAALGTLLYLVFHVARQLTGRSGLGGRQLFMATLVPALALVVTLLIGGQHAGLFALPFGHRPVQTQRHVITVEKNANGQIVTHTSKAPASKDH